MKLMQDVAFIENHNLRFRKRPPAFESLHGANLDRQRPISHGMRGLDNADVSYSIRVKGFHSLVYQTQTTDHESEPVSLPLRSLNNSRTEKSFSTACRCAQNDT